MQLIFRYIKKYSLKLTVSEIALFLCLFTLFVRSPFPPYGNYEHDKISIYSDGFGYYSYLPAVFIHHDLHFDYFNDVYKKNYRADPPDWERAFIVHTETGVVNKYWIGVSVLLLPFFLLAHWLSLLFGLDADGYSLLYQYAVFAAALFYLYLGIRFTYKFLIANGFVKNISAFSVFAILFGTNLFYYAIYQPSMSHVYSFFCISGFLYLSNRFFLQHRFKDFMMAVFFFVIVVLVRPVNIIALTLLPFAAINKENFSNGLQQLIAFKSKLLWPISLFFLFGVQVLIWHHQNGKWLNYSYPGETFNFTDPHFIDILFSYKKGFFLYMPICFVALLGLASFLKNNLYLFFSFLLPFLFIVYVLSSWYAWDYSACFGNRAFIDFYFPFALLIATSYKLFNNRKAQLVLTLIYIVLIFFNHIQTHQYRRKIYLTMDMNKENYWKVFLKTSRSYENLLYDYSDPEDITLRDNSMKKLILQSETDFETEKPGWSKNILEKKDFARSGKIVAVVSDNFRFSDGLKINESELSVKKNILIETELYVYLYSDLSSAYLVHQHLNNEEMVSWKRQKIYFKNTPIRQWTKIKYTSTIDELKPGSKIVIYVGNDGNSSMYIDDFKVTLYNY